MTSKRGPYASPLQIERRLRVLKVTLDLLYLDGLQGVTLNKVAKLAGVSKKTLYNIYGSREELLVKAASFEIDSIQISEQVTNQEAGIPQLISFSAAVMGQFRKSPEFMSTILHIVFQANDDKPMSETRIRHIYLTAIRALEAAQANGELRPDTDIKVLADMIAANQWGSVFLWVRDIISLEEFTRQTLMSHCTTLLPFCIGPRKKWLEQTLEALLKESVSSTTEPTEAKPDRPGSITIKP